MATSKRKHKSKRSGPSIPDAQRRRPARRITLAPQTWARLDQLAIEKKRSVSSLIEEAVLARR